MVADDDSDPQKLTPCFDGAARRMLVHLARRALWAGPELHETLQEAGVQLVPANFYSSVPRIADVRASFEYRDTDPAPYEDPRLFDRDRHRRFLDELLPYAEEWAPPHDGDAEAPAGYFWNNPAFSYSDAMAYYCMVRHLRPRRIVEVGAGFSTLVADAALRRNGDGSIVIVEPWPKPFLRRLPTVERLIEQPVQALPVDELVELVESSELWFIDSTHTVKVGSDCLRLYLQVMPRLAKEIVVHSHDVFLPFALPQAWAIEKHIHWTEPYLLYALLVANPHADVLFGSAYAAARLPDELRRFMGGKQRGGGGSLWYRWQPPAGAE